MEPFYLHFNIPRHNTKKPIILSHLARLLAFKPVKIPRVNFPRIAGGLVLVAALAPLPAFSLDLYSAIQEVDAKHPQILAKRQQLIAAESGLSAAKQQLFPTLSVSSNRSSSENAKTYAVTRLQQPLFAGGRITAGIDRAEAQIKEAQALLGLTRRDLLSRTAVVFHEVLKNQERLKISDRSVEAHQALLDSIGRRVSAEVSPESDLMISRSRLSQAQTERTQVNLALIRAQDALRELLERTPPPLAAPASRKPVSLELVQALSEAEAYAPEVKQLLAQESIASSEVSIQRSAALPNVFVRHENLSNDRDPGLVRDQTYVGVEFVPGAGFSVAQQIKAAESRRLAAIEARRSAEKDVRERVRTVWSDLQSLKSQLASARSYVESSNSVKESFIRQFSIGRKTWVEVLNATREAFQAELALADIEWNLKIAELRLEIETGRMTPDKLN
jgi:outer membrane protein, adhesin transport system